MIIENAKVCDRCKQRLAKSKCICKKDLCLDSNCGKFIKYCIDGSGYETRIPICEDCFDKVWKIVKENSSSDFYNHVNNEIIKYLSDKFVIEEL